MKTCCNNKPEMTYHYILSSKFGLNDFKSTNGLIKTGNSFVFLYTFFAMILCLRVTCLVLAGYQRLVVGSQ